MSADRVKKSYRIQLSVPIALLLLGLGGICLVAAFYLGLVAGKSLRQPAEAPVVTTPRDMTEPAPEVDQLRFFNLSKGEQKEELNLDSLKRLSKKTKQLKEKTPVEVDAPVQSTVNAQQTDAPKPVLKPVLSPKTPKPPAPGLVVVPAAPPPKKPALKAKPVKRVSEPQYTVQVFAARNKKNSERMVKRLKKNGFPKAYIYKYITSDSKALYRVRVGRTQKIKADSLAKKLKSLKFIDSVQVIRY